MYVCMCVCQPRSVWEYGFLLFWFDWSWGERLRGGGSVALPHLGLLPSPIPPTWPLPSLRESSVFIVRVMSKRKHHDIIHIPTNSSFYSCLFSHIYFFNPRRCCCLYFFIYFSCLCNIWTSFFLGCYLFVCFRRITTTVFILYKFL